MITKRSDTPTGTCCSICNQAVIRPWGARRDDYLVCDACVARHQRVAQPIKEELPDLSDSFWRIATGDKP